MTTNPNESRTLDVSQAAREFAADIRLYYYNYVEGDKHPAVQAFARFEQKIRDEYENVEPVGEVQLSDWLISLKFFKTVPDGTLLYAAPPDTAAQLADLDNRAMDLHLLCDKQAVMLAEARAEIERLRADLSGMATKYSNAVDWLNTGFEGYLAVLLNQKRKQMMPNTSSWGPLRTFAESLTDADLADWSNKDRASLRAALAPKADFLEGCGNEGYPPQEWLESAKVASQKVYSAFSRPEDSQLVEEVAQFLHDEGGFDEAWQATWPEHPDDTGQREGGFVRIVPTDVQAKFRDVSRRLCVMLPASLQPHLSADAERDRIVDFLKKLASEGVHANSTLAILQAADQISDNTHREI